MTLLELLGDILEGLRAPYGVTWAVDDHTVAQTGYVFNTLKEGQAVAERGPWLAIKDGYQVDGMCEHYPEDWSMHYIDAHAGITMWGHVETEDATITDVLVTGGAWIYS